MIVAEDDALHALRISEHASMGSLSSVYRRKDEKRVALALVRKGGGKPPTVREGIGVQIAEFGDGGVSYCRQFTEEACRERQGRQRSACHVCGWWQPSVI